MIWQDDGEHPLPEVVLVGICPGDGLCLGAQRCRGAGKAHVYYWTMFEEPKPTRTVAYVKEGEEGDERSGLGRATYVVGGLLTPEADDEREMAGAGAGGSSVPTPAGGWACAAPFPSGTAGNLHA